MADDSPAVVISIKKLPSALSSVIILKKSFSLQRQGVSSGGHKFEGRKVWIESTAKTLLKLVAMNIFGLGMPGAHSSALAGEQKKPAYFISPEAHLTIMRRLRLL